jgi:hypothetical protein
MNSPAALEMITRESLTDMTPRMGAWLRRITRLVSTAKVDDSISSLSSAFEAVTIYQLGDIVRNSRYGAGMVKAHFNLSHGPLASLS